MNAYLVISSLLNCSAALVLALTAFVTARRDFGSRSFGAFALSVGLWSGAYSLWRLSENADSALLLCRLLMIGAIFIPITLLHFAFVLTGRTDRFVRICGYTVAVFLAFVDLTPGIVESVGPAGGLEFWPRAGAWFWVLLLYFFSCTGASLALLLSRKAGLGWPEGHRRLVAFLLLIGFVGGSTNFPLWYGIPVPPVGNGLVFVYLCFLGFGLAKYRLPHVQTDLLKSATFFGISSLIGAGAVLGSIVVGSLTDEMPTANALTKRFFFGTLLTVLALWAIPLLIRLAERALEQNLSNERFRLQRDLKGLLRVVGAEAEESAIFQAAAEKLALIFRAKDVAIYFHGELEPAMRLRAESPPSRGSRIELCNDDLLVRAFSVTPASVSSARFVLGPNRWRAGEVDALVRLGFELGVPVMAEGRVVGIILLNRAPSCRDDSDAILTLLEAVGVQLALTIMARRLERRANQAEKLIALGTLAAGLSHELRNPLTSIHTFVSLVESGANPGQDPRFLRIVQRDTQRITSIIENVSVFASNAERAMGPVQLEQVLNSTLDIARGESVGANVRTVLHCTIDHPVHGNYGQLQQVFVNLVQNAIQAIGTTAGEIELSAEPIVLASGESGARVVVRDNGPGVAPEVLPRMFEPFVTTKAKGERTGKSGLGLGLAIVKRIVEAHHGDIRVESAPGQGTRFFVYLPAHAD